jgi:hypothetical protein
VTFITEVEKYALQFIWKQKRLWIAKSILSKRGNAGGIKIPDFKLYYKAIAIKTAWYWHKNRHKDQWNRIEDPDMNPHNYTHLMFDNDEKHMMEKRQPCQQMLLEKVVIHLQKLKLDPCLSPCTSINSKWMKDPKYQTWNSEVTKGRSRNHSGNNR